MNQIIEIFKNSKNNETKAIAYGAIRFFGGEEEKTMKELAKEIKNEPIQDFCSDALIEAYVSDMKMSKKFISETTTYEEIEPLYSAVNFLSDYFCIRITEQELGLSLIREDISQKINYLIQYIQATFDAKGEKLLKNSGTWKMVLKCQAEMK